MALALLGPLPGGGPPLRSAWRFGGSANMASGLAGQHGRNVSHFTMNTPSAGVHERAQPHPQVLSRSAMSTAPSAMQWANPLITRRLPQPGRAAVAANAQNGEAQVSPRQTSTRTTTASRMASCCIPVINQPVIDGVPYFDGGLADPRPAGMGFAHGCDPGGSHPDRPSAGEAVMPGTSIWHTCCSRITPLQPRAAPPGMAGPTRLSSGRGSWSDRALSASSPRTAPRNVHPDQETAPALKNVRQKANRTRREALVRWMQNTKQDESVGT